MSKNKKRVIAFYLPQFYPTPENDKWWAPGFTEWTNVAMAKPMYKGHYQPRIPGELSFYDLRLPSIREQQAELARIAGIEGFCYWHYWFGGQRLLDLVFKEVVESGKPDFPFCLCWANHSWYAKTWDPTKPDTLLMEQTYPGKEDYIAHFNAMLSAFKDKRYIRVNGKLLFGVFAPYLVPDVNEFIDTWNQLAHENNLEGFEFFAFIQGEGNLKKLKSDKYDRLVYDAMHDAWRDHESTIKGWLGKQKRRFFKIPNYFTYDYYTNIALKQFTKYPNFTPCIDPDFDHSPRSAHRSIVVDQSTPEKWGQLCSDVSDLMNDRKDDIVFVKAWNEWGEGNYLEPDLKHGRGYIEAMSKVFNNKLLLSDKT